MQRSNSNQRRDDSVLGRLSARTRATIDALTKSKTAARALEEVEAERIAERQALLAELKAERDAYPGRKQSLEQAACKAAAAFDKAEIAFRQAHAAKNAAVMAAYGAEVGHLGEVRRVEDQLRADADGRLAEFVFYAEGILENDLVAALQFWVSDTERGFERLHANIASNVEDVQKAKAAVRTSIENVKALQLEAIGYAELSQRLMAECERLAPILAKVGCNCPTLTAADAEVGPPLTFTGAAHWVVDLPHQMTPEECAAKREAQRARAAESARVN